jgi:hypothetical protein
MEEGIKGGMIGEVPTEDMVIECNLFILTKEQLVWL